MKIILATDKFPPQATTVGELVLKDGQKLMERGHEVLIVTIQHESKVIIKEIYENMEVRRMYSPNFGSRFRNILSLFNPWTKREFTKILEDWQPDIVHFHNLHEFLSYPLLAKAARYSRGVILTSHDVLTFAYDKIKYFISRPKLLDGNYDYKLPFLYNIKQAKKRYNPWRNIIISHYLRYVNKIVCVSHELEKALNQNGISNTSVLHNGIDTEKWQADTKQVEGYRDKYDLQDKKVVLFASRLSGNKGSQAVLEAMSRVVKQDSSATLLIVGEKSNPKAVIGHQALENNLVFTGRIPHNEMKNLYHLSNLVVTPSIYLDPFPTVNLEAMACSKPVVATCYGGSQEAVLDGQTGFVVNPFDTNQMAEKIIYLLNKPKTAIEFGREGYKRLKDNFTLEIHIDNLLRIYNKILIKHVG